MKRLVLAAALLFPFAASATNDNGFKESLPNIERCVDAGGDKDMCGMMFATTEELALLYRASALDMCERHEANKEAFAGDSNLQAMWVAEYSASCAKGRAYIKDRWGLLPRGETK